MNEYMEYKLLEEQSQVKSPPLAAILGFFLPPVGFLYVGKIGSAIFAAIFEVFFFLLSFIGIGIPLLLLWGCIMAYGCYDAAKKANAAALRRAMASRQQPTPVAQAAGGDGAATP